MIKLILSLIVLIITYFLIFTNRRIRTTSTFFGAILTIALGLITFNKAITYIDFNKLGIIIGMMIFTIIAKESGIFQYLALKATKYSKGNPLILLITLSLLAGFLSSDIRRDYNTALSSKYYFGYYIYLRNIPLAFSNFRNYIFQYWWIGDLHRNSSRYYDRICC